MKKWMGWLLLALLLRLVGAGLRAGWTGTAL